MASEFSTNDTLLIKMLLKPVMRFCLRRSLKLQEVIEAAKSAMLEVAQEEQNKADSETSISRLSIMTGIHRADVMRLQKNAEDKRPMANVITRVIGQWRSNKRFKTADGRPRILEFESKTSEFADLVKSVSHDLNPYTVLFELERIDAVERKKNGLKLISKNMVLKDDAIKGFELLSSDANDLICAVEENIFTMPTIRNLHLKTEFDKIGISNLEKIKKWLLVEGSAFQEMVCNFIAKHDRDINPKLKPEEKYFRVAIATFSRIEEE